MFWNEGTFIQMKWSEVGETQNQPFPDRKAIASAGGNHSRHRCLARHRALGCDKFQSLTNSSTHCQLLSSEMLWAYNFEYNIDYNALSVRVWGDQTHQRDNLFFTRFSKNWLLKWSSVRPWRTISIRLWGDCCAPSDLSEGDLGRRSCK